jgi:hypothetical protein
VFRARDLANEHENTNRARATKPAFDYANLLSEPGDGLITRSSQVATRPLGLAADDDRFHPLPAVQTFFLCESHGRLTHNLYFQNNLLYFLMAR